MTPPAIERLRARLPPAVRLASAPILYSASDLLEAERPLVERAVPKRVREFSTGRVLARRLLSDLGFRGGPLLRAPDRAPSWPEGAVGSISHTDTLCVVLAGEAAAVGALGVDLEANTPLEENLFSLVLTAGERSAIERHPPEARGAVAKIAFSAKESFYKCQYSTTRVVLDFADVELELDLELRTFQATVMHAGAKEALTRTGRHPATGIFEVDDELIATAMVFAPV